MTIKKFDSYSYLLDRTARRVKGYAQQRFASGNFDITIDQWLILKSLDDDRYLKQKELAELTGKDTPTLTRIIDLLCKKGLTERVMHKDDRRSFTVHLTEAGKAKLLELSPKISEIRMKAWENLTEQDYEQLKMILNKIYQNLES
ncbi:MarR family winged helix-turn-helix transcriptional regulator [Mucilaginibacter aquariorum]|uniref:MarR family transcriptional regulator n=1 Tax=Mucilaginibacter aquariorum TaxID=2967225 RepID=A0ABT1T4U5_9SPHI|nr:MarR family transcriptional regulator [Mucilaginibacter aquariorum]MCQ6959628.1 MarR family transcriptional regulator [Mucilaginibacter aquariorum]